MAMDVYLRIDGIKGESRDDKRKDWIEVTGVHWGIHSEKRCKLVARTSTNITSLTTEKITA